MSRSFFRFLFAALWLAALMLAAGPCLAQDAAEPGGAQEGAAGTGDAAAENAAPAGGQGTSETPDTPAAGSGYTIPQRYVQVDAATGLAIGGYDPVAYFVDHRPRLGLPRFEFVWSQTIWRFVNEGNLAAFREAPEIYAPQFGGHDARALADDQLTPGDPKVWAVYGERLYLFYSPARRFSWLVAPDAYIRNAEQSWDKRLHFTIAPDLSR